MIKGVDDNEPKISLDVVDLVCSRDDIPLIENLSFSLKRGQVLLVEGRNGSGKTTLLRTLCGIRSQDSGQILWCGESIDDLGPVYHEQMAYVGHHDGIKRDLTVLENLALAQALGKPGSLSIDEILQRINLSGYEDIQTHALSAGQRRRLALARLLATDSQLWILDEPFTSLDKDGIVMFEELIASHTATAGMVVMTSHHDVELQGVELQQIRLT